jgi:putative membrane protein
MFYWSFWGMSVFWWAFWALLLVVFFATLTPVPRGRARLYEDPLDTLKRRYARGELSTAEYDERRQVLLRSEETPPAASDTRGPGHGGRPVPRHA